MKVCLFQAVWQEQSTQSTMHDITSRETAWGLSIIFVEIIAMCNASENLTIRDTPESKNIFWPCGHSVLASATQARTVSGPDYS